MIRSPRREAHALLRPLIAAALSLTVVACGSDGLVGLDDPLVDSDHDSILNGDDACPGEAETLNSYADTDGCPDDPMVFYEAIREDLETYWTVAFPLYGETYRPLGGFTLYSKAITTLCGPIYPGNVNYCSRGEGVYYDLNMLQAALERVGEMGPAFIIAHAIGGHISWLLEWTLWLTPNTLRLQADCWGGAWAKDAVDRGWLDVTEPAQAVAAVVRLDDAPGTWFDASRYGTPDQRTAAFEVGFTAGPPGCASAEFFDIYPE